MAFISRRHQCAVDESIFSRSNSASPADWFLDWSFYGEPSTPLFNLDENTILEYIMRLLCASALKSYWSISLRHLECLVCRLTIHFHFKCQQHCDDIKMYIANSWKRRVCLSERDEYNTVYSRKKVNDSQLFPLREIIQICSVSFY